MPPIVGLDASKKATPICVLDRDGAIVQEGVSAKPHRRAWGERNREAPRG
jgi:hypothetical protein